MDPWRYSTDGISVSLRVTPRGGRNDIDGIDGDPARFAEALRTLAAAKKE